MSESYYEIGQRLKKVRKSLNLTQKQIGDSVNLSTSFISELESGIQKSCTKFFRHLASEYKVNIDFILTGRGSMFIEDESPDKIGNTDRFGKDKHVVKEMLTFMLESDVFLYGMLSEFAGKKKKYPEITKELIDKHGSSFRESK